MIRIGFLVFVVFSVVVSSLGGSDAFADGGMFERTTLGKATKLVASPRQEALLILDGDRIEVTLRTSFREGPTELAWVIPIPKKPEDIREADNSVFTKLETMTAPTFEKTVHIQGIIGIGCGASDKSSSELIGRVAVTETGKAGIYEYTVLTATETTALTHWLSEHEYNIPEGAEPIFKYYVDQGWYWLAIRLDAQSAKGTVLAPHPIRYTYRDKRCAYPLLISRLSADDNNEVLLYILSNGSRACENWANRIIETNQLVVESGTPSGTNYERLFRELTRQEEGHLFVTEFAHSLDTEGVGFRPLLRELIGEDRFGQPERTAFFLTRLRAVIRRDAMDRDVIIVPKQVGRYDWVDSQHRLTGTRFSPSGCDVTVVILFVLLVSLLVRNRIKRRRTAPQ
jgi:hypothetical protein